MADLLDRVGLNARMDVGTPTDVNWEFRKKAGMELNLHLMNHVDAFVGGSIDINENNAYPISNSLSAGARLFSGHERLTWLLDAGFLRRQGKTAALSTYSGTTHYTSPEYPTFSEKVDYASWFYHLAPGLRYQALDRLALSFALTFDIPQSRKFGSDHLSMGAEAGLVFNFF